MDLDSNLFGLGLDSDSNLFGLGLDSDSNLFGLVLDSTKVDLTTALPILGMCALHLTHPKCTRTAVNTHTPVNTQPEQWAAIFAAAPEELLGVQFLAQGHLICGIEGEESAVHSLPPPTIPAGPETRTRNFLHTSPTL